MGTFLGGFFFQIYLAGNEKEKVFYPICRGGSHSREWGGTRTLVPPLRTTDGTRPLMVRSGGTRTLVPPTLPPPLQIGKNTLFFHSPAKFFFEKTLPKKCPKSAENQKGLSRFQPNSRINLKTPTSNQAGARLRLFP